MDHALSHRFDIESPPLRASSRAACCRLLAFGSVIQPNEAAARTLAVYFPHLSANLSLLQEIRPITSAYLLHVFCAKLLINVNVFGLELLDFYHSNIKKITSGMHLKYLAEGTQ